MSILRPMFDSLFHAITSCYVQDEYINIKHNGINSHGEYKDKKLPPMAFRLSQLVFPLLTLYRCVQQGEYIQHLVDYYDNQTKYLQKVYNAKLQIEQYQ
eukprot:UN07512